MPLIAFENVTKSILGGPLHLQQDHCTCMSPTTSFLSITLRLSKFANKTTPPPSNLKMQHSPKYNMMLKS